MNSQKLDPVDGAQRDRIRLHSILSLLDIGQEFIHQPFPGFPSHPGLMQIVEVVQMISPQLTVVRVVPIDSSFEPMFQI